MQVEDGTDGTRGDRGRAGTVTGAARAAAALAVLAALAVMGLTGCGGMTTGEFNDISTGPAPGSPNAGGAGGAGGSIGATPGGAQDIGRARKLIEQGKVPSADTITVEGLLSEHDLPVRGEECDQLMCVRPALGVAPSLKTGKSEYWVHLGTTSGLKADEFERPPLDLVFAIDKSSSMSIDMAETNKAVTSALDKLDADDRVAVVTYDDSPHVLQKPVKVGELDRKRLKKRIHRIKAQGSANMRAGLSKAYELVRQMEGGAERMGRVITLSCGYPPISKPADGNFTSIVKKGAADGIGLTFVGVLLGYNRNLVNYLGQTEGANYFYAQDLQKIETIFDEEFDFMVTPLAYNLEVALDVHEDYEIAGLYGLPGDDEQKGKSEFSVETVFASKRDGAMLARLRPTSEDERSTHVAQVDFAYDPEPALGFPNPYSHTEGLSFNYGDTDKQTHFDTIGVRKAVALVNMAEQLQIGLRQYHEGAEHKARETLEALKAHLKGEAAALEDENLDQEFALVEKLIINL